MLFDKEIGCDVHIYYSDPVAQLLNYVLCHKGTKFGMQLHFNESNKLRMGGIWKLYFSRSVKGQRSFFTEFK